MRIVIHYLENLFEFKVKCKLRILEIKPTEGSVWPNKEKVLFEASKGWIKAPPLSSLFMTVARCCTRYDEKTFKGTPLEYFLSCTDRSKVINGNDSQYVKGAISSGNLPVLLKYGPKLFLKKMADNYRFRRRSLGEYNRWSLAKMGEK